MKRQTIETDEEIVSFLLIGVPKKEPIAPSLDQNLTTILYLITQVCLSMGFEGYQKFSEKMKV